MPPCHPTDQPVAWRQPPSWPHLGDGEVHVWRIRLDAVDADAEGDLSPEERERARRFRFERDRTAWIGARAWLRRILAVHLETSPNELVFSGGPRDKPTLVSDDATWLGFNMSHSGTLALVAVSAHNEVGVDVECIADDDRDLVDIARRVFCGPGVDELVRSPAAERPVVFSRMWVRNEARVKCDGSGLTDPTEVPALAVDDAPTPAPFVYDLEVGDHYAAALATRREPVALRLWAPE